MVSLWGSKKDGNHDLAPGSIHSRADSQNGDERVSSHQAPPQPRYSHEADERTHLLPPSRDGFLSPDDPAVCSSFLHIQSATKITSFPAWIFIFPNTDIMCI